MGVADSERLNELLRWLRLLTNASGEVGRSPASKLSGGDKTVSVLVFVFVE